MKATEQDIQYALDISRGEGALPQWSKTLEALVSDHREMKSLLKRALPHIACVAIPVSGCDHRAARAGLLQGHMEGFLRTASTCQKCGDPLRHDDDGPTLCRFCSAAHPNKPGDQAGQPTEAER